MADNHSENSSILSDATNSTIYRLNGSDIRVEDSVHSISASSMDRDSLNVEDFNGFTLGDLETDHTSDPFAGIFYHMMPLQDTTTIMFYNKPIFSNILEVLGKQFQFPAVVTRNFQLKTYVEKNKCILKIDKAIMSISATGPGHILWKEKCFKNLAESLFRTYVDQTNTVLETRRNNYTLSGSQDSTQNPEDNEFIIDETVEEPEAETPAGAVAQQPEQVVFTHLQDSMVLRKISVLMDMISTMQSEMSKLTKEVNDLAAQHVASQTLYRTVDETNASLPSLNQSAENEKSQQEVVQEEVPENNETRTPITVCSNLPSPSSEIPNLQTRQYSEVLRTSTPRDPTPTNETPHRPRPAPRRTLHAQGTRPSPRPAPRARINNNANQILLIGDSLISSVNPKGLLPSVIKNGISGGNIEKINTQIRVYDIRKFSHVIVYVGGNDASSGIDIEYFEEMFDQVIQYIKESNSQCKIHLCLTCPRGDTSTKEVNDIILSLAQHYGIGLIDQDRAFHNKHGNIITGYYDTDNIHLSTSGVKRLLGTINAEVTIVSDFAKCAYGRRQGTRPQQKGPQHNRRQQQPNGARNMNAQDRQNNTNFNQCDVNLCYKCGESNHDTNSCRHKEQLKCFHCGFWGHKSGRCLQKV